MRGIPFFSGRNITIRQASPPRHRNAASVRFRPNLNNRRKSHSSLKNLRNSSSLSSILQLSYLSVLDLFFFFFLSRWQMQLVRRQPRIDMSTKHGKGIRYMAGQILSTGKEPLYSQSAGCSRTFTACHPLPPSVPVTTVQHVLFHAPSFRDGDR